MTAEPATALLRRARVRQQPLVGQVTRERLYVSLEEIRCRGCRRLIGTRLSQAQRKYSIYCDPWCATEPPVSRNQARNDELCFLVGQGLSPYDICHWYGVSPTTVYKAMRAPSED